MSDVAVVLLSVFVVLLLLGVPVVFTLGLAAVAGLIAADTDVIVLAQRVTAGTQIFSLLAIPGFILAGELMETGGLSKRMIRVAKAFVGHLTGGLGMVTVISGTLFAAISGSAPATTAAIGGIMIPEMGRQGYRRDFSAALAAAAGPIGHLIPPSIPFIVWGIISEQSIAKLFLAGVIPGLLICIGLLVLTAVAARRMKVKKDSQHAARTELFAAINDGKWALAAPVIVLGGIYGGIFTPTEAAAIGVLYGAIVGLFVYRELAFSDLPRIFLSSMKTMSIVVFIIATASAFGWVVSSEQIPEQIAQLILNATSSRVIILLLVNLLLLALGCVIDTLAAMIMLGTVLISIGHHIGIDPIQLGAIIVVNFAIGQITPPVGYSLFIGAAISKLTIEEVARQLWPMILVEIIVLMLVTYVPAVTLTLPRLIR
jgi:tripartite ATP-independent transporter DctM subunit